jgi:hypothetical protein
MARGTAAHALAERCWRENRAAVDFAQSTITVERFSFIVDGDMLDAVEVYLRFCAAIAPVSRREAKTVFAHVEEHFDLGVDFGGTADFVVVYPESKTMIVADYKHGAGVPVSPENNPQAMIYALGAFAKLGAKTNIEKIRIVIVQPRYDSENAVKDWWISTKDLLAWQDAVLLPALTRVRASSGGIGDLRAGAHCRFCPGLAQCPRQLQTALETARQEFSAIDKPGLALPLPEKMTPDEIGKVLRFAEMLAPWADAVKDRAQSMLMAGQSVLGFKLVEKRPNRQWIDAAKSEEFLTGLFGEKAYKKTLITPAQAEKLFAKKDAGAIAQYVEKPDAGLTIASEEDKRPAVSHIPGLEFIEKELEDIF